MFEDVCYRNAYLAEVILKVDFSTPIPQLGKKLPAGISQAASARFPISEPQKSFEQEWKISKAGVQVSNRKEFTMWNFHGVNREKRLTIGPEAFFVSFTEYGRYEDLVDDFFTVADPIRESFPEVQARRVGLRYINKLDIPSNELLRWDSYINPSLLGLFEYFDQTDQVTRLFHIVELRFDQVQVKFQFGVPNPDFPAPVRRPQFVLDLDGVVHGPQDFRQIRENVDLAHAHIQEIFEKSITNGLRELIADDN